MSTKPPRPIKSAERTLALFELFSREQRPFSVGRVSEALGMPQASASMLLRNLTELGYLEYDRSARTFSPSIRVALLGSWIDRRFSEAGSIGMRLDALQRELGETAWIGIQNGASAQYVISQQADHPEQFVVNSGQFRSLTCSAVGRALLSLKSETEVMIWARRCNVESTDERLKVRESEFKKLIQKVKSDGFALTAGDVTPGLGAIAIPLAAPMGQTPLALAIGGTIERMAEKREIILKALFAFKASFQPKPFDR